MIVKVVKAVKAIEYADLSLNKKLNPYPNFYSPYDIYLLKCKQ